MQKVKQGFPMLIAALIVSMSGQAKGTEIDLSGIVVASPCTVDTGTQNQTVTFRQARAIDYQEVGDTSEWQDFSLTLSRCPVSTTRVVATFIGDADLIDTSKFANSQGDAQGIALQLMTRDHNTEIAPSDEQSVNVDNATRNAIFLLSARMYTPTGQVTAGEFNTVVQVNFTYQ